MMDSSSLIKLGALGVGAYLLWQHFSKQQASGSQAAQPDQTMRPAVLPSLPATPVPAPVPATPAPTPPPAPTNDLKTLMLRKSGPGLYNADQWNYFYHEVRGIDGPDPLLVWPGRDRAYRMTWDEWWAGVSGFGLSGLGALPLIVGTIRDRMRPCRFDPESARRRAAAAWQRANGV